MISPELQLAFDGREVTMADSQVFWHPRETQKLLLRLARRPEGVTALQAGNALHAARRSAGTGTCGVGAKSFGFMPRSKACCLYASSDGSAALKRLRARGVVEQRKPRGPYFAVLSD